MGIGQGLKKMVGGDFHFLFRSKTLVCGSFSNRIDQKQTGKIVGMRNGKNRLMK